MRISVHATFPTGLWLNLSLSRYRVSQAAVGGCDDHHRHNPSTQAWHPNCSISSRVKEAHPRVRCHLMKMPRVLDLLAAEYGEPRVRGRPPLDELVLTILSQNTSDVNRDRAYAAMRERFPTWQDVIEAPVGELEAVLRPGGLARQKAPRIQAVLARVAEEGHGLDLRWLAKRPPEEAMSWLTALPGVGLKTASIVLLFSFGEPVMPVDTHVYRVATRLGLLPDGTTVDRAHALLTNQTPPDRMLEGHLLLIEHGRRICGARRPRCGVCPLRRGCPYGKRLLAARPA
jgi:endonuclease III